MESVPMSRECSPVAATYEDDEAMDLDFAALRAQKTHKRPPLPALLLALWCGMLIGTAIMFQHVHKPPAGPAEMMREQPLSAVHPVVTAEQREKQVSEYACGRTYQEARGLGCQYDIMAGRWFPPACWTGDVLESMLDDIKNITAPLPYFSDVDHQIPVDLSVARAGQFEHVFTSYEWHIYHCLYLWRRLHSALIHNRRTDDDTFDYHHTVHCTRSIAAWKYVTWGAENHSISAHALMPGCRLNAL